MPDPKKKDGLAIVLGGMGKSKDEEPMDEKAEAMQDLGEALKAGDWSSAALAFERAYEICASKTDDEDEEPAMDDELGESARY